MSDHVHDYKKDVSSYFQNKTLQQRLQDLGVLKDPERIVFELETLGNHITSTITAAYSKVSKAPGTGGQKKFMMQTI
eukprot:15361037-Ditylum_brightwellii.AAC.1